MPSGPCGARSRCECSSEQGAPRRHALGRARLLLFPFSSMTLRARRCHTCASQPSVLSKRRLSWPLLPGPHALGVSESERVLSLLQFCTFGSRQIGRGYYVFDSRWNRLRCALNLMVEKHLNAQLWK